MKWRLPACIVLTVLALAACRSTSSPVENPNSPGALNINSTADYAYIFEPNNEPIQLDLELQSGQSVAAAIPVEGGVITASGADGTTYRLEIPPDALLSETTIRMTPLASLSGLPFGAGPSYAVQLEPEGLQLNNFARLTISPAQALPADQQIVFGYEGDGQNLALALPVVDSDEIQLQLLHFSGYGVSQGLLADIEPVRRRLGGEAEARLQSLIGEVLLQERQRQLLGQESETDLAAFFADVFQQYEAQVVAPRVAAAGESCAAGRLALQTVLGFERQKQLLGLAEEGSLASLGDLLGTVTGVCVQEEYQLCAEEHLIHRMLPLWLGLERQYQLLGAADESSRPAELEEAKKLTQQCLTFELAFESQATFDAGEGDGFDSIVQSRVKLRFNPDDLKITGEAPLVNQEFEFRVKDCNVSSNRGGSTFTAINLAYQADAFDLSNEVGAVRDFSLIYWPAWTSESYTVTCPDNPPFATAPSGYWSGVYLLLHSSELTQGSDSSAPAPSLLDLGGMLGGMGMPGAAAPQPQMSAGEGYLAEGWELQSGDYLAKIEWIKDEAGEGLYEAGTLKLYHRPGN